MNEMITLILHKIYTLRGKKVMLDFDLAELYEVAICDIKFKEVFNILDTLVNETKKTDEKAMGFIKS